MVKYGRGSISGISKEWMTDLRYEGAIASLIDMCAEGMDSDFLPVLKKGERIRMWNLYPERFRPYIGEGEGIVADTHQLTNRQWFVYEDGARPSTHG